MRPRIAADEYERRLKLLRAEVGRAGLDQFLVSSSDSIYYLTGAGFEPLERPFFLVVPRAGEGEPTLVVPRLDADHMKATGNITAVRTYREWPAPEGRRWLDALSGVLGTGQRIGIEPTLNVELAAAMQPFGPAIEPLVEGLRRVKSPAEIEMIRRAARYADRAVQELLDASYRGASVAEGFARTGLVTRSIIRGVDRWEPLTTRVLMATWAAPRSVRPHSIPALADRLGAGPHVALALTRVNGYAAESERTFFTTAPTPEQVRAFRAMLEARAIAARMVRPGVACAEIDAAVAEFLKAEGYDGELCRLHRTGHGIGLGNHEAPWIAVGGDDVLVENMVISIEPGIYLDGEPAGGFRHSDTVAVTRDGCEWLTRLPTDLASLTLRGWRPATRLKGALVRRALRVDADAESRPESSDADVGPEPASGKRRIRTALALLALPLVGLLAAIAINTLARPSKQLAVPGVQPLAPLPGSAERLARALQFATVATAPPGLTDPAPFVALREFLQAEFPRVHRQLGREVFGHSLLFRWAGTDPSVAPILLMSHLDVVPVEQEVARDWTHPPFSGRIVDGFIWGRGALDVKCGALGMLEAAERLLADGFRPTGDVYFAFGHDEEVGGREGNARIAAALRGRGVRFRFVLDEGGGLTEGIIDGMDRPVAFVGIAERGYATIRITARAAGGHSSMPPPHTAVGLVSAAVARLEADPFPARIDGATAAMFDFLGPEMSWPRRAVFANRWLTGGLIARQFAAKPSLNALIRTTAAATVIQSGVKPNVLPQRAEVFVNARLRPGDTAESARRRVQAVADAEARRLGLDPSPFTCSLETTLTEASRVTPVDAPGFRTLHRTIAEVYADTVVAPGLSMVATDSRHYAPIASEIYRFLPLRVTGADLERIHGRDERIGVRTYADLIGFVARLILNAASESNTPHLDGPGRET